jgi:hypothetical protein
MRKFDEFVNEMKERAVDGRITSDEVKSINRMPEAKKVGIVVSTRKMDRFKRWLVTILILFFILGLVFAYLTFIEKYKPITAMVCPQIPACPAPVPCPQCQVCPSCALTCNPTLTCPTNCSSIYLNINSS